MSKPPVYWSYAEQRYWINTPDGVEWFDGPLEAEDAAAAVDRRQFALAEVKLIAEYFRRMGMNQVAASIEAGDYKK